MHLTAQEYKRLMAGRPAASRGIGRRNIAPPSVHQEAAEVRFVAHINPMGKPTMTHADKWQERPRVIAYRAWADAVRDAAPELPENPGTLSVVAYLALPESWSQKKKAAHRGRPHASKPDSSNIIKGIEDALFSEDKTIYRISLEKRWDDGAGPRMEITVGGIGS